MSTNGVIGTMFRWEAGTFVLVEDNQIGQFYDGDAYAVIQNIPVSFPLVSLS